MPPISIPPPPPHHNCWQLPKDKYCTMSPEFSNNNMHYGGNIPHIPSMVNIQEFNYEWFPKECDTSLYAKKDNIFSFFYMNVPPNMWDWRMLVYNTEAPWFKATISQIFTQSPIAKPRLGTSKPPSYVHMSIHLSHSNLFF